MNTLTLLSSQLSPINLNHTKVKHHLLLTLCILLTACSTTQVVQFAPPQPINPKADTTLLPTFSGEVFYILGREWEAIYDSTSAKYQSPKAQLLRADSITMAEYIEQRLIELYPEKAYNGYVQKIEQIVQTLLQHTESQQQIANFARAELAFNTNDSIFPLSTTPNEQHFTYLLDSIALSPQWTNRSTLDSLDTEWFEEENALLSMMLWRGSRFFYRIIQSKARAEKMAEYYYGEQTNSGMQGDAFRHIYVNVLLRSYVGEWVGHVVMDLFWEIVKPNAPCDRYMDLHNNRIGRQTLYHDFVYPEEGAQCNQVRDWLQWAEQVQQFVQDSANSHLPQWDKETPTFIVQPEAQQINPTQYIYWKK